MSRKVSGRISSVSRRSPTGRRPVSSGTSGTRESREENTDEGRLNTPSISSSSSNVRLSSDTHDTPPHVTAPNSLIEAISHPLDTGGVSQNQQGGRDEPSSPSPRAPLGPQVSQDQNRTLHALQDSNESTALIEPSSNISQNRQEDRDDIVSYSPRASQENVLDRQPGQEEDATRHSSQVSSDSVARNDNHQRRSKKYLYLTIAETLAIASSRAIAPVAVLINNHMATTADKNSENVRAGESWGVFLGVTIGVSVGLVVDRKMTDMKKRLKTNEIADSFYENFMRIGHETTISVDQVNTLLEEGKAARDRVLAQNDIYGGLATSLSSLLASGLSHFSPISGISAAVDSVLVFVLAGMVLSPVDSRMAKILASWSHYVPSPDSREESRITLEIINASVATGSSQGRMNQALFRHDFDKRINQLSSNRSLHEAGFGIVAMILIFSVHIGVAGFSTKVNGKPFYENTGLIFSGFAGAFGAAVGMTTVLKGYWQREDARTARISASEPHNV